MRILGTALLTLKRAQEHLEAEESQAEPAQDNLEDEDYDGGNDEETGLPIDETALGAGGLHISFMDSDAPEVTDKTFDFYLKTMPSLDKETFEAARARLDNLAKPKYSLGSLEDLASRAERTNITGTRARPDCGEKPEMGAEGGLVCSSLILELPWGC